MAYQDPKTDWTETYEPSPSDMNRIEGNIKNLQGEAASFDGDKTFNDNVILTGNADFNGDLDVAGSLTAVDPTTDQEVATKAYVDSSTEIYIGSDASNIDFPVGTYLYIYCQNAKTRNQSVTVTISTGPGLYIESGTAFSGTALNGTWSIRGGKVSSSNDYLVQRIS